MLPAVWILWLWLGRVIISAAILSPIRKYTGYTCRICNRCNLLTQVYLLSLVNSVENPANKRRSTLITVLNISETESRFYKHPFTCLARNTHGMDAAYVQLIYPGKQQANWNTILFYRSKIPWPWSLKCHFLCLEHSSLPHYLGNFYFSFTLSSWKLFCPAACP